MEFSVLMSIYHKEKPEYFNRCMESIWDEQTVKPDEIVLVQDGPLNNNLYKIIDKWKIKLKDSLVRVALEQNIGLASALNEGLKYCKYELIARMDTDDISIPERFEKQLKVFKEKEIDVCGGYIKEFNIDTNEEQIIYYPELNEDILKNMKKRNSIAHVTTMMKKSFLLQLNGYDKDKLNEDYDLWIRGFIDGFKFYNIPEVLVKVRTNNDFFNRRKNIRRAIEVTYLKMKVVSYFSLGVDGYLYAFAHFFLFLSPAFVKKIIYKNFRKEPK